MLGNWRDWPRAVGRRLFRLGVSGLLGILPAAPVLAVLELGSLALGVDWKAPVVDTLLNTHWPWLTTLGDAIKTHADWAPATLVWLALALVIYQRYAHRIEFFALSPQNYAAMQPAVGAGLDTGIVPWVVVPDNLSLADVDDGWVRQRRALGALGEWVRHGAGDGRWGVWPRQPNPERMPGWLPLSFALLTGANGTGKSAMALHFAAALASSANIKVAHPAQTLTGWRARLSAWCRTVLPWLPRHPDDAWDVGLIPPGDAAMVAALQTWEPRRPTFLVIDEPSAAATEVLKVLEGRRGEWWHPVRVLLIDQSFPPALDSYRRVRADGSAAPFIPLAHGGDWDLGDAPFKTNAARVMWDALCSEPWRASDGAKMAPKLWRTDALELVVSIAEGNPLQIALVLDALLHTSQSPLEWYLSQRNHEEALSAAALLMADHTAVRRRLLDTRVTDLMATYQQTLRRHSSTLEDPLMTAIAVATLTGGGRLAPEVASRCPRSLLDELFPARVTQDGTWIPPIRPTLVAQAYLRAWVARFADPPAAARLVADAAWQSHPEGAIRAMRRASGWPAEVREALASAEIEPRHALNWAKACGAAVLSQREPLSTLERALDRLTPEEWPSFAAWFVQRLAEPRGEPLEAWGVLMALHCLMARSLRWPTPSAITWDWALHQIERWAPASASVVISRTLRLSRIDEFANELNGLMDAACARFAPAPPVALAKWSKLLPGFDQRLRSVVSKLWIVRCGKLERDFHKRGTSLAELECLAAYWEIAGWLTVLEQNARSVRRATAIAGRIGALVPGVSKTGSSVVAILALVKVWRYAAFAASLTGGKRALEQAGPLAERVEEIATAQHYFLSHPEIQAERAGAWSAVVWAAGLSGGAQVLDSCQALAERVDAIACAQSEFLGDVRIQTERAVAWRYVAHVASLLGGERAVELSRPLAERVEAIALGQPTFLGNVGIQAERGNAWRCVAFATSRLGGARALELSRNMAERVEDISTAQPEFHRHVGIQAERARAWRCVAYACSELPGERALEFCQALAERVEAIANGQPEFSCHAGMQAERAQAWCYAAHAASLLGGERALELSRALAKRVEAIALAQPEFLGHVAIQMERAKAWRSAVYAAGGLGGDRALECSRILAARVEEIATAQPVFLGSAEIQEPRAQVWRFVAFAASQLGGERALELAWSLAERVEAIATAQPALLVHAGIQEERAQAWRYAAFAASQLGGERALELARPLAERVEAIATAQREFLGHAGIQEECAEAWRCAAFAASQLGGDRGLELARSLAERVETIATAQREFLVHAGIQAELAEAWRHAAFAASQLDGDRGLELARSLAERVEAIATAQPEFLSDVRIQQERRQAWDVIIAAARARGRQDVEREAIVRRGGSDPT